ncbi:hypothetical protein QCF21_13745 [Staphylococcus aureus]|nr:hypothetical protein [Staphylococcus aureus]
MSWGIALVWIAVVTIGPIFCLGFFVCLFVCFKRKLVIFDELCIFEVKMRDFQVRSGILEEKMHHFRVEWGILEEKLHFLLVKWGILEEKLHEFRLHVRFL